MPDSPLAFPQASPPIALSKWKVRSSCAGCPCSTLAAHPLVDLVMQRLQLAPSSAEDPTEPCAACAYAWSQAGTRPLGALLDSDFCPFSRAVSEARCEMPAMRCLYKLFQARVTSLRGIDGAGRRLDNGGCTPSVSQSTLHVPCWLSRSSEARTGPASSLSRARLACGRAPNRAQQCMEVSDGTLFRWSSTTCQKAGRRGCRALTLTCRGRFC